MSSVQLHAIFHKIEKRYKHSSEKHRVLIENVMSNICELLYLNDSLGKSETDSLNKLRIYTSRRLSDSRKSRISKTNPALQLRELRNQLVHRGTSFVKDVDFQVIEPILWKVLEGSANEWDSVELYNLLSYIFNIPIPNFKPTDSNRIKMIRFYKAYLNTLSSNEKSTIVEHLLIRLFSMSTFKNAVLELGKVK